MEIKTNQTVYKCEFCSEYYLRKHHAENHEKKCRLNPSNRHKCFEFCKYLDKSTATIDSLCGTKTIGGFTVFKCTKYNKFLHSYKAEHSKNGNLMAEVADTERMPLECEGYAVMTESPNAYNTIHPTHDILTVNRI